MTTITSPAEGFTGTTHFGPLAVEFTDGKADVEDLPDGIRDYMLSAGYKVGRKQGQAVVTLDGNTIEEPVVDSRDVSNILVGTELRDAAVDPEPGDFLAPVNAGEADPHSPNVVSPEIHAAVGPGPIAPGTVGEPGYQDAKESAVAEAVRVDQQDATEVAEALGELVEKELEAQREAAEDGDEEAAAGFAVEAEGVETQGDVDEIIEAGLEESETAGTGEAVNAETGEVTQPGEPLPEVELKGEALETALEERGLPKTGSADEKRARVAEHDAAAKGKG